MSRRSTWARFRERGTAVFVLLFTLALSAGAFAVLTGMLLLMSAFTEAPIVTGGLFYFGPWIILGAAIFATIVFRLQEAKFRYQVESNVCTQCNYDLRGSIEAGRGECPECGCMIERLD